MPMTGTVWKASSSTWSAKPMQQDFVNYRQDMRVSSDCSPLTCHANWSKLSVA